MHKIRSYGEIRQCCQEPLPYLKKCHCTVSCGWNNAAKTCDISNWVVILGFSHRTNLRVTAALWYHHFSASSWICDIPMSPIISILKSRHLLKNLIPFIYLKTSWYTEYIFHGNDPKTGQSSTFAKYDMQKISFILYIFRGLNIVSIYHQLPESSFLIEKAHRFGYKHL